MASTPSDSHPPVTMSEILARHEPKPPTKDAPEPANLSDVLARTSRRTPQGKTALPPINLSEILAMRERTIIVDNDPQGTASGGIGD